MSCFELLVQKKQVTYADWSRLIDALARYDRYFIVEVQIKEALLEFYIHSHKKLQLVSNNFDGFTFLPCKQTLQNIKASHITPLLTMRWHILEIKEKEEIQNGRSLFSLRISVIKLMRFKFFITKLYFKDNQGNLYVAIYYSTYNSLKFFELNFEKNSKVKKRTYPIFLKNDDIQSLLKQDQDALLQADLFPTKLQDYFLDVESFTFNKHSLIVGQTGVGKSKFIELYIKKIARTIFKDQYVIVVIDPHASLYHDLASIQNKKIEFDFISSACNLFGTLSEPKVGTELTIMLFKSILSDQFNAKMERLLKYVLFVLFIVNKMSLDVMKDFLIDVTKRKELLGLLPQEYDYLKHFFETDYSELQTKYYEIAIMPILTLIDELSFIPAFFNNSRLIDLEESLKNNFLISFSLNRISLGEKATKLIAGLIIQQIFLIAQKRILGKKIILVIDEVSIIETESLISILSEARKFDLSLFLSQQYLTQVMPSLLQGILANTYNYFVFKVSDSDAKILANNLDLKIPDEILKSHKEKGFFEDDVKRNLMVTLNPRECLTRVFANGKFYPCFKGRTVDVV